MVSQDDWEFNDFNIPESKFFGRVEVNLILRAVLLETACLFFHSIVDEYCNGKNITQYG
jgi:hypothetical protein